MFSDGADQVSEPERKFMRAVASFGFKVSRDIQWLPDTGVHGMEKTEILNPFTLRRRAWEEVNRMLKDMLSPYLRSESGALAKRVWNTLGAEFTIILEEVIPKKTPLEYIPWNEPQPFPSVFEDETDITLVVGQKLPLIREHMFPILATVDECDTCYSLLDTLPPNLAELPPQTEEIVSLQSELGRQAERIYRYEDAQAIFRNVFNR